MSNTEPTKNHNIENKKDEQHGTHQKPTTQKTKEMSNTEPTKNQQHRKLKRGATRNPPKTNNTEN
jgi:hypothetical protein